MRIHPRRIRGRFILSVNDVPETREVFGRFSRRAGLDRYTIAGGQWAEARLRASRE
jgi:hypothetical protein